MNQEIHEMETTQRMFNVRRQRDGYLEVLVITRQDLKGIHIEAQTVPGNYLFTRQPDGAWRDVFGDLWMETS